MTQLQKQVGFPLVALCMVYGLASACHAGNSPIKVDSIKPPNELVRLVAMQMDSLHAAELDAYGDLSLRLRKSEDAGHVWLLAIQQKKAEYCSFLQIDDSTHATQELVSYVGCKIQGVTMTDINGDGVTDALYEVVIQGIQHEAKVVEQVVFMPNPNGKGFCKSDQSPKFLENTRSLRCQ